MGQYLYAITRGDAEPALSKILGSVPGLDDAPLAFIAGETLGAVVSGIEDGPLRPRRQRLAAHQRVLDALARGNDALPMGFGFVAPDGDAVRELLVDHREELHEELDRLGGRVEMSLRLRWDVDNVAAYFVERDETLRSLRDRLASEPNGGTHETKMAAGRAFERLLEAERTAHFDTLEQALRAVVEDIHEGPLRTEHDIANLGILVARDAVGSLERCVLSVAGRFDESFAFDLGGPWAPFSFVNVRLGMAGAA